MSQRPIPEATLRSLMVSIDRVLSMKSVDENPDLYDLRRELLAAFTALSRAVSDTT